MNVKESLHAFVDSRIGQAVLPDKTVKAAADLVRGAIDSYEESAMPSSSTAEKALFGFGSALVGTILSPFILIPALAWDAAEVVVQPIMACVDVFKND